MSRCTNRHARKFAAVVRGTRLLLYLGRISFAFCFDCHGVYPAPHFPFSIPPQDKRRVDIEKEKLDEDIRIKDLEMQYRIAMQNIDSSSTPVSREMSARERVLSAKLAQSRQATPPKLNRR